MTNVFPALYCDGTALGSRSVSLVLAGDGRLRLEDGESAISIPLADVSVTSRLAHIPRFLRLPTGATVEVAASDDFDAALDAGSRTPRRTLLHTLESHGVAAAAATVLLVATVGISLLFGLPRLAQHVAKKTPVELEKRAGQTAFSVIAANLGPTTLSLREQRQATQVFLRVKNAGPVHIEPSLVFRSMNVANAFALPGGIVLVSDQLVHVVLSERNGEDLLAAVYAHELAHVERRHGLQSVLRSSAALLAVATITGDLSTLTTFSSTLPFILIQRGYSREFESEADADAVVLLKKLSIKSDALAEVLSLLEKQRPKSGPDFSYLSTHPSTDDRIKALRTSK